jgi:hypothetical protein
MNAFRRWWLEAGQRIGCQLRYKRPTSPPPLAGSLVRRCCAHPFTLVEMNRFEPAAELFGAHFDHHAVERDFGAVNQSASDCVGDLPFSKVLSDLQDIVPQVLRRENLFV